VKLCCRREACCRASSDQKSESECLTTKDGLGFRCFRHAAFRPTSYPKIQCGLAGTLRLLSAIYMAPADSDSSFLSIWKILRSHDLRDGEIFCMVFEHAYMNRSKGHVGDQVSTGSPPFSFTSHRNSSA
jgi:hypothetical protein